MTIQPHGRPTQAIIDLDALAYNFHSAKSFIGSAVKYMAVVKADAYGHGAIECASRLEAEGADWFGVVMPEEGVELRKAGITLPIVCFGSFWPGQEELIVQNCLTPVVYDRPQAASLDQYAREHNMTIDVHVKVDSGMGRVGIPHNDALQYAKYLTTQSHLKVTGLMTHFAAAENPNEDAFTEIQIKRFNSACDDFRTVGHSPQWIDLANSPGAISHPDARGNMVRLGGALYGLIDDILSPEIEQPELKAVLSLRSRVAYVRKIAPGESLGYGRTFVTERDSLIALVPIGYADGYPRGLSNRGRACIKGQFAPVVGRVSMDWTLLDVTDIPDPATSDEVFLIGGGDECSVSAADLAGATGTIGYEITCGISRRVPRVFTGQIA